MPKGDRQLPEGRIEPPARPASEAGEVTDPGVSQVGRSLTDPVGCARDYAMAAASLCDSKALTPAGKGNIRRLLRLALEHVSE